MTSPDLPRPDVPAPIAVVRDFVNTTDHETGIDDLLSQTDLERYLVREGLLDRRTRATRADLALALELRAGLRRALELNHVHGSAHLDGLDEALRALPVRLGWAGAAPRVEPAAGGVTGAITRIGLAALEAADEGIWWRLKICASDECEWAYYDHSKNRSRSWCEYGCGNKLKTRAYRARQRSLATDR